MMLRIQPIDTTVEIRPVDLANGELFYSALCRRLRPDPNGNVFVAMDTAMGQQCIREGLFAAREYYANTAGELAVTHKSDTLVKLLVWLRNKESQWSRELLEKFCEALQIPVASATPTDGQVTHKLGVVAEATIHRAHWVHYTTGKTEFYLDPADAEVAALKPCVDYRVEGYVIELGEGRFFSLGDKLEVNAGSIEHLVMRAKAALSQAEYAALRKMFYEEFASLPE